MPPSRSATGAPAGSGGDRGPGRPLYGYGSSAQSQSQSQSQSQKGATSTQTQTQMQKGEDLARTTTSTTSRHARFQATVQHLAALLTREEDAEELAVSWWGGGGGGGSGTTAPSPHEQQQPQPQMTLRDLKRMLDTGRRVNAGSAAAAGAGAVAEAGEGFRPESQSSPTQTPPPPPERGIPLWIVVRTCKASWHADGTWPLLAADEAWDDAAQPTPRSVHAAAKILRPRGVERFEVPPVPEDAVGRDRDRADPDMDEVARRYRARGVDV